MGGYSDSGVSGDKTVPSKGQRDFWALKLDASGNIVWQKAFGSSLVDRPQATFQTSDGGYILGGFSNSGISGDKTEASRGGNDYWIIKMDGSGNLQWDHTFGGNDSDVLRDIIQSADGGFLAAGYSKSNISGDKTENSQGDYDAWILKLDGNGNMVWQNTIGGSAIDYPRDVKQLPDNTYLVANWSNSNISGDKTENSNGGYDYWLMRLNSSGGIISQNSIGGSADESGSYSIPLANGNIAMFCSSDSNISGDKGDNSRGLDDYWVFEATPDILGTVETTFASTVTAYPNPTQGKCTIDLGALHTEATVSIFNHLGQLISAETFYNEKRLTVEITGSPGVYIATIHTAEGRQAFIKITKR